jgi:UDP-N-acetylglucosamine 3-dehydrogenase
MLKIAVAGTGLIATKKHFPAWQRVSKQARVVALCDINREQATKIAGQFGIPATYTDVGEMLEKERPDVVDICTPPRTHAPLAIQCLESKAHVLIEKPMAASLEECDAIIRAAEANNRRICMAHSDLFYPSVLKARQIIERGQIGTFRGMHIFLSTPTDYITSKADHWANKLPGGVIGETGPHIVYLTLAFINPIEKVLVHGKKLLPEFPWSPFEDYRVILSGASAVSSTALTYAGKHWAGEIQFWGTDGILRADMETQTLVLHRRPALTVKNAAFSTISQAGALVKGALGTGLSLATGQHQSTHARLIREFVDSLNRNAEAPVTAQEGRESIRVMSLIAQQLEAANTTAPSA